MKTLGHQLKLGAATMALAAAASVTISNNALAQGASDLPIEEVVVTGTSIRGIAPIGSNLMTVGLQDIEKTNAQTLGQVLSSVPALTGMGQQAQGQLSGSSYYAPNIHQLGSSASTSTLVLIDGHRIPLGANGHDQADPNIVPTSAIQRVEVLADGSSSIYGSDAVAGVVNIITRKTFDGVQLSAQAGFSSGYNTRSGNIVWGTSWAGGTAMLAASYSDRGALANINRPDLTNPNHIAQGGTNFDSFNCAPATIQPAGSSNIYLSAASASFVSNAAANAPCYSKTGYLANPEVRSNIMGKISQEFLGGKLKVSTDILISNLNLHSHNSPGTITATVFSTGAQANSFYINPPGVTATTQTVRFSLDGLLQGNTSVNGADVYYIDTQADYNIDDNYRVTFSALFGHDTTFARSVGGLCASCAYLALNGTTNSTGSLTTPSVFGTNGIITKLPLNSTNELDVWNPVGTNNRTSAAVLTSLQQATTFSSADRMLQQFKLGLDGSLFDLPGGAVRVAVGGEFIRYGNVQDTVSSLNIGPSSLGSAANQYSFSRSVYSIYGELVVPLVAPERGVFLVKKAQLDVSGRYDNYNDVGPTSNPKVALNWQLLDDIEVRANISTSFVAPAMDSRGDPNQYYNASFSGVTTISGPFNINTAFYPQAFQFPGCTPPAAVCAIGSSTVQGLRYIRGGGPTLKPQTGRGWSVGAHITPTFLPGFSLDITNFNNSLHGGVTSPNLAFAANVPASLGLLTLYPTGATAAQIQALTANIPQTSALPNGGVFFIDNFNQQNILNLWISGYDVSLQYQMETDNLGRFSFGDTITYFTKFKQQVGDGGITFSVLNSNGFNQTFPSVQMAQRFSVGWDMGPWAFQAYANYTGAYRNWGANSVIGLKTDTFGSPIGGGDHVNANITVDAHVSYTLITGMFGETELFGDVSNLFDKAPPFYNSAAGYDAYEANPIGRVFSVGVREKF